MIIKVFGMLLKTEKSKLINIYQVAGKIFECENEPTFAFEKDKTLNPAFFSKVLYELIEEHGFKTISKDDEAIIEVPHFLKSVNVVPCEKDILLIEKLIKRYHLEEIPYDLRELLSYGYVLLDMECQEYFDYIERNMKLQNYEFICILSKQYAEKLINN